VKPSALKREHPTHPIEKHRGKLENEQEDEFVEHLKALSNKNRRGRNWYQSNREDKLFSTRFLLLF
jgi:hypothetical protein